MKQTNIIRLIALLLMCWPSDVKVAEAQRLDCTTEFNTCTCTSPTVYAITCKGVSLSSIQASFQRTQATYVSSLSITLEDNNSTNTAIIPPNFTNGKPISGALTINCPAITRPTQQQTILMIDPLAIASSAYYTTSLTINSCDLSALDFAFLNDFRALVTLSIQSSTRFNYFLGLPSLAGLSTVSINGNQLLEQLNTTLPFAADDMGNVKSLSLSSNALTTKSAAQILSVFASSSLLSSIDLSNNLITSTTQQLFSFPLPTTLKTVNLNYNKIALLTPDSFALSARSRLSISLQRNGLNTIRPGALFTPGGNSIAHDFNFDYNQLTRFDSEVFQPLLEARGSVSIYLNPINCDCRIAWLIRDNRNLLSQVSTYASCSDGTYFTSLNPDNFKTCDNTTTTSSTTQLPTTGSSSTNPTTLSTAETTQSASSTTTTARPTCPPYDPNIYTCTCETSSCQLNLIPTTTTARPTCPPYDPNVYTCICGATSCILQLIPTSTTSRPSTESSVSTVTRTSSPPPVTGIPPTFTCPPCVNGGNHPLPGSCVSFISCSCGEPTIIDCAYGLVYNKKNRTCDWPHNVPDCRINTCT